MKLCFIHIPKAAGTSMNAALAEIAGPGGIFFAGAAGTVADLAAAPPETYERIRVVCGHVSREEYATLPGPKVFAAVLREPVARAVSLYEYIVRGGDPSHPDRPELLALGLERAVERSARFRDQITNFQCGMLAGKRSFRAARAALAKDRWIVGHLDRAQCVLDGVASLLGAPRTLLPRKNASQPGYFARIATPRAIDRIRRLNREDQALFDHVSRLGSTATVVPVRMQG